MNKRQKNNLLVLIACIFVFAIFAIILHGIGASPFFYLLTFYVLGIMMLVAYIGGRYPQALGLVLLIALLVLVGIIGQYK